MRKFKKIKILSLIILFGFFIIFPLQSAKTETETLKPGETKCDDKKCVEYVGINPDGTRKIQVIKLAPPTSGDYIESPYLGDYIASVYKYAIGVITVLAVVFLIIAGLQWAMSGGSSERIGQAKKMIVRSMTGLLIALGSYTILWTINPQLVNFQSLKLLRVQKVEIMDILESLGSTTEKTEGENFGSEQVEYITGLESSPITLSSTKIKPGKAEFMKKIVEYIQSPSNRPLNIRQRVAVIAEIAVLSKIELGSCGNTAGSILSAAGVSGKDAERCREGLTTDCGNIHTSTKKEITSEQRKFIFNRNCLAKGYKGEKCEKTELKAMQDALQEMIGILQKEKFEGRMPGWPENWANQIQLGDYVIMYTGGKDETGSHAVIFMGWAKDGITMNTVSGQADNPTSYKSYCVGSIEKCGKKFFPLIYIHSPE